MTNKSVKGIVTAVRNDKKGLQLDEKEWYSSKFFKGEVEAGLGDEVEVEYEEKGEYKNLKACKIVKKGEGKEAGFAAKADDRIIGMLTSYIKDEVANLRSATIQIGVKSMTEEMSANFWKTAAANVLRAYKQVKEGLCEKEESAEEEKLEVKTEKV